jgi:hypothetical protein
MEHPETAMLANLSALVALSPLALLPVEVGIGWHAGLTGEVGHNAPGNNPRGDPESAPQIGNS